MVHKAAEVENGEADCAKCDEDVERTDIEEI